MAPKNRKAAKSAGQHPRIEELDNLQDFKNYVSSTGVPEVPLVQQIEELQSRARSHPSTSSQSSSKSQTAPKRYRKSQTSQQVNSEEGEDEEDLTAVGQFMFDILDYSTFLIPLLSVHLVLDILVHVQYTDSTFENMSLLDRDVLARAGLCIPVFALLHHFVHPMKDTRVFRIGSFIASVATGGYLLYAGNEEGYYATMKRAPPLGTLWVWMFIEMEWAWSASSLVVVAFWMWLRDYSL